jgi:acetyl esterase/lipase
MCKKIYGFVLVMLFAVYSCIFASDQNTKRYRDAVTDSVDVKSAIVYAEHENALGAKEKLTLDLYIPENDSEKKRSAILLFHGGSFMNGSKETYYKMAFELAKKGFVVVPVDYRLRDNPQENFAETLRDAVEDGAAAVQWIASHGREYGVDPNKIFVGGDSAGAILSLNLVYARRYDEKKYILPDILGVIDLYGGDIMIPEGRKIAPAIIIHGDKDVLIPYSRSVQLSERFKKAGVFYDFFTMTGEGHAYRNKYFNTIITRISAFACTVLENK